MNPIIDRAKQTVDQAELYWNRTDRIDVRYANYSMQTITQDQHSSVALRVVSDGKLGTTYGITPDQDGLLEDARTAAAHGDPATFSFAPAADYPEVRTYDGEAASLTSEDLVALCEAAKERIRSKRPDIALAIQARRETFHRIVQTTHGADAESRSTAIRFGISAPIKGAGIRVVKSMASIAPFELNEALVEEFLEWYGWTEKTSTPSTGRLPVILAPEAAFLLHLPLCAGLSADAVQRGTSPLCNRVGEQILSEKLTLVDNALLDGDIDSRAFDDEGVPCQKRAVVEAGVLKGFLVDQRNGAALSVPSTGNARKKALFGEGTELSPNPWPINLETRPGEISYREMIADLDEGLLLTSGMGFHSGNYPQGQFSVQAVGFHIRDGRVVGRLDKTMVSGDIYRDLLSVRAVSREQKGHYIDSMLAVGRAPYILIDELQVAGQ